MFAERYIRNNVVYLPFIQEPVSPEVYLIVVIPCLNEPEILRTLDSLWACAKPRSAIEVIVTINDSDASRAEIKAFNQTTFQDLLRWKSNRDRPNLILHPFYVPGVPDRFAGAGMARKIGMDEAVRRFNTLNRSEGVIVGLDADCLVSRNYFTRIEAFFSGDKNCFGATINFRHRFDEMPDERQKLGIRLYEDYLHYYKKSLDFTGFPNSIYTIGSAFAVRADAYVKQGGMNRRKAGEDFYFLHKLTKLGRIREIADAFVFPSGRVSNRVPFGTGASMTKWMDGTEDLTLTYNFAAFAALKKFFDRVDKFYRTTPDNYQNLTADLPEAIQEYLKAINFAEKLNEINKNSSTSESFRKRFFQYFDAFVILRFLNFSHQSHFRKQKLSEAIELLRESEKL